MELREKTFDVTWETVNEAYYDPTFGGVDWAAMKEKYRARLPGVSNKAGLRVLLQEMLAELRRSHFAILPRELAVFTPGERVRIGTIGLDVSEVEGAVVVSGLNPASAASRAGLRLGDAILKVDQLELVELRRSLEQAGFSSARCGTYLVQLTRSHLQKGVGSVLSLVVSGIDGQLRPVEITFEPYEGVWSEPMGDFPSQPVQCVARHEPDGTAYLHFNIFARVAMKDIRTLLRSVPAGGGLVLDLRGNQGGIAIMASGIAGWLSDREYQLGTMHLRQGHLDFSVAPQAGAFLGPVAVLIDSGSASASEILAAGLQEARRARIFGEPSAGAALPSSFKTLPSGDILQYVIADLQTPAGVLLEGRGVVPDEPILLSRKDIAEGHDPVVEAARRWLREPRDPLTSTAATPEPRQP